MGNCSIIHKTTFVVIYIGFVEMKISCVRVENDPYTGKEILLKLTHRGYINKL